MKVSELWWRIDEMGGTEIVAAMAMDLTSTIPTTLTIFQVLSQGKVTLLVVILQEISYSAVNISIVCSMSWLWCWIC